MRTEATATVGRPPAAVYAFLSDLENHWQLANSFVSLDGIERDPEGGWITVRGPFGITRRAHTSLVRCEPPTASHEGRVEGIARAESGTLARVTWHIEPEGDDTRVGLETAIECPSRLDGLLLRFGGRLWLRACLQRTLAQLVAAQRR